MKSKRQILVDAENEIFSAFVRMTKTITEEGDDELLASWRKIRSSFVQDMDKVMVNFYEKKE